MREILRRLKAAAMVLLTGEAVSSTTTVNQTIHVEWTPTDRPEELFEMISAEARRRAIATTGSSRCAWESLQ